LIRRNGDGLRLLIVGAGPTQEPLIRRAREMGLDVMAVDANPQAPGLSLAHHPLCISTLDVPAILAQARPFRPHGVTTVGSDRAVSAVAQIASALRLPGLDPDAAARANSKLRMRQAFQAHRVPAPRFIAVGDLASAESALAELGSPVVIKPVDNAAQRGVRRLDGPPDLPVAFAEAQRFSRSGTVLLEQCVEGPEITVSSFTVQGKLHAVLVADRFTNPPPYLGIALAHVYPSQWAQPCWQQVLELTRRGIEALGIDQGPAYTQLRIDRDGPKIMEIGARIGGGRETELVAFLGGPDWMAAQIKLALGQPLAAADVVLPDTARSQAGVVKFIFGPPGQVKAVSGLEQAGTMPGVKRVVVRAVPGVRIPARTNAEARQGYLIALGTSRDQALARVEAAAACISIEVRPGARESTDHV
jgi:biotin carboxylase